MTEFKSLKTSLRTSICVLQPPSRQQHANQQLSHVSAGGAAWGNDQNNNLDDANRASEEEGDNLGTSSKGLWDVCGNRIPWPSTQGLLSNGISESFLK